MRWRYAALALAAAVVAGCSGASSQPATTPAPTPAPTPTPIVVAPPISLKHDAFLDLQYLSPTGWHAQKTKSDSHAGNVNYVAPARRGTMYVEESDCAACVDQGLVMHGHRNGVADPFFALRSYFPTSQHRVDNFHVTFTTAATKPYVGTGKLVVTKSGGQLTGYAIVIVKLPTDEAAVAARILASLHVR